MLKISNLSYELRAYIQDFASFHEISTLEALERIIVQHRANTSNLRALVNAFDHALTYIENEAC